MSDVRNIHVTIGPSAALLRATSFTHCGALQHAVSSNLADRATGLASAPLLAPGGLAGGQGRFEVGAGRPHRHFKTGASIPEVVPHRTETMPNAGAGREPFHRPNYTKCRAFSELPQLDGLPLHPNGCAAIGSIS